MRSSASVRDLALLLLAAGLVALYALTAGSGFPLDDSWIHQTYARNLALRGEWAFLPGEPSAASTSPLYTVLLAVGYLLRVPYLLWTHGLGAAALAAAGMVAARMADRQMPQFRWAGWVAGLAVVLTWHHVWAAAAGMETMLFATLILSLIYLAWQELDRKHTPGRALLLYGGRYGAAAALAVLARPEGVVLGALIVPLMLMLRPQGNLRLTLIWGSAAGVALFLLLTPYLLLNLHLTGGLLPDTAAAKLEQHAILLGLPLHERIGSLLLAILAGGQFLLLPGMVGYAVHVTRQVRQNRDVLLELLPLLWALALVGLYALRLPASYQHGRYVIPALPALVYCGVIGTLWLLQWMRNSLPGRVLVRTLALAAAVVYGVFSLVMGPQIYRTDVAIINEEMVAAAQWIAENLPPEELLAVHDIGAVGYFAPRPILDIAGLVSPEVIPVLSDAEALWDLMQVRGARYLMAFPDQIPGDSTEDDRLCPLYASDGTTSTEVGGPKMVVYRLAWDDRCPPETR